MKKYGLYVLKDEAIGIVSTPYCFESDESAKRFFVDTALQENSPVDDFVFFKVGDYYLDTDSVGDESFKLVSLAVPVPITFTPSEIESFVEDFYKYHPLHAENAKLRKLVADLNSRISTKEEISLNE